ncbi:hypothetical protein THARTR1_04231 [Trichoderma harzianum]|uniref:Uncharacterized protein n=1 Tax=Trichoderma harzianum TaxID=5544 RepID=A0A2K0UD76_TRIHA|nr:hypothetical protein THARTR1_04231 [Trichoderma harzianum]
MPLLMDEKHFLLNERSWLVTGNDAQVIFISAMVVQDAKKNRRQG